MLTALVEVSGERAIAGCRGGTVVFEKLSRSFKQSQS